MSRLDPWGVLADKALQRVHPDWDGAPVLSILVERESLSLSFAAFSVFVILAFTTVAMHFYEKKSHVFLIRKSVRARHP